MKPNLEQFSVQQQQCCETVNEGTVKTRELCVNPLSPANPTEFQFQSNNQDNKLA